MAAIIHPQPCDSSHTQPRLRLVPGAGPRRRMPAIYRRRRAVVALVIAVAAVALGVFGWVALEAYAPPPPATAPARVLVPAAPSAGGAVVVVQPGDSLWSVARRIRPHGDPRPTVTRLARFHGAGALQPGERLPVR